MRPLALRDVRWLWTKVRRRIETSAHHRRIRRAELSAQSRSSGDWPPALPWPADATPPGFVAALGLVRSNESMAAAAREHRWTLLASEPFQIDAAVRTLTAQSAADLPPAALAAYRRIEWHTDFRSGYRWNPSDLYLDVRVAPVLGADIKVPRELSRFQHIGALASYASEQGGVEFLLEVLDWIDANPPRRGVNWACTMDVALRAANWIWGLRLFEPAMSAYPQALRKITASLHEHALHIENNLEYYEESTSNHYLSDIAGLLYIGAAFPQFPEADRWLRFALQELVSEMDREVYTDGGDHEASTHYHRLVAELFVSGAALAERLPPQRRARLARVDRSAHRIRPRLRTARAARLNLTDNGSLLPDSFYERLARMAELTAALTKPNGLVPQFGDNDSARVHKLLPHAYADVRDHRHLPATVGELLGRVDLQAAGVAAASEAALVCGDLQGRVATPAARVDINGAAVFFPDSGIAVVRRGEAYLAVTCGPNGQGGRGGHGHNDKNSFELNIAGLDFIVDGGCPVYTAAPDTRNRYRSTAAHNTVGVVGEEQDRWDPGLAGLFRLPERSAPRLEISADGTVTGRHSGFGPVHERRFRLEAQRLIIEDRLEDRRERYINFNLDPSVDVEGIEATDREVRCRLVHARGRTLHITLTGAARASVGEGCFSVGYGVPVSNKRFTAQPTAAAVRTQIEWPA